VNKTGKVQRLERLIAQYTFISEQTNLND